MVTPALRLLQGRGGGPYALLPGAVDLPLMVSDHVGPTSTYLVIPFLYTFGIGLRALRLYEFAVGLASLLLIAVWARRVVRPGTAWVAALLLAATPSLWLACRNGLYIQFLMVPLVAAALICLYHWQRDGRVSSLYAGCLALGIGLSTKILFIWLLFALAVSGLALKRQAFGRLRRREIALGISWFALGAMPLLLFNLLSRGLTVRTLLANIVETRYGVHNTAFLANLSTQLRSFVSLLGGSWLTWAGDSPHNAVAPWLFLLAGSYLLFRRGAPHLRSPRFCLMALGLILVASCFTITTLGPKHLVIMLPFTTVVIAAALGDAWSQRRRGPHAAAFALLSLMVAASFTWDLGNSLRYHRSLATTGGVGQFSAAHDRLAEHLVARGVTSPLAGDWGFSNSLEVLSAGRIIPRQIIEMAEPAPYEFTREQARRTLINSDSVYLFHDEVWAAAPGRLAAVADVASEMEVHLLTVATFRDGLGRPVIRVYRPLSRARNR